MGNKIAISNLAVALSQSTGRSKKLCEDFIKEFFRLAAESLEDGEPLKIKGFGTFKITEIESRNSVNIRTGERHELAPYKKVVFTPAKELASIINAPFEEFESVEMEDEVPEDFFVEPPKEDLKISDENSVSNTRLIDGSEEENSDDIITYEAYNEIEHEKPVFKFEEKTDNAPEINVPDNGEAIESKEQEYNENEMQTPVYENDRPRKSRFGIGFLTGALSALLVCIVIFMLGCFFHWWPVNFGDPKTFFISGQQEIPVSTESVEDQNEEPEIQTPSVPSPVYDTVTTTRYLTTIAREHYGDFNFWPYIYIENESILGHPDRITPGTRIVVPDLSKYGVSPGNKADVQEAKRKAREIYSRFQ